MFAPYLIRSRVRALLDNSFLVGTTGRKPCRCRATTAAVTLVSAIRRASTNDGSADLVADLVVRQTQTLKARTVAGRGGEPCFEVPGPEIRRNNVVSNRPGGYWDDTVCSYVNICPATLIRRCHRGGDNPGCGNLTLFVAGGLSLPWKFQHGTAPACYGIQPGAFLALTRQIFLVQLMMSLMCYHSIVYFASRCDEQVAVPARVRRT